MVGAGKRIYLIILFWEILSGAEAKFVQDGYTELKTGETLSGTIGKHSKVDSPIECSSYRTIEVDFLLFSKVEITFRDDTTPIDL